MISSEKLFKINQRIEIMLSNKENCETYPSRIEEIIDGHLVIAMPLKKGYPIMLVRGSNVYGKVFTESGVFAFKTMFVDKKMSPLPIWIIRIPLEVEKTQQRSFVRLNLPLPVTVEYKPHEDSDEVVMMSLMTRDISGGGMQLIAPQHFRAGTYLNLTFDVPEQGIYKLEGVVVRSVQPMEDRQLFWVGVKFIDVSTSIRDKISKFVLRKQLEQRRKI